MIELLGGWVISFIASFGYAGIFFLMLLESALIPIPSEVTMPFSGSLVATGLFNFWVVIIAGTIGNLIGSLLAYWLGYWGEESIVRTLIRKYGKYILISEDEYDRSELWFRRHGEIIVFVTRILPVFRTFISLPAGVSKMNLTRFIIYTVVGCFIWSYILTKIGVILGNNWDSIGGYFHKFDAIIIIGGLLFIVWYIRRKVKHLKKNRDSEVKQTS